MNLLHCEDSRRLTGANLYTELPGAVLDLKPDLNNESEIDFDAIIEVWKRHTHDLLKALSWDTESSFYRSYENGVSLGITAPIDCLYSAVELIEFALLLSAKELKLGSIVGTEVEPIADFNNLITYLEKLIREEENPALLALQSAARKHNAVFLFDDDIVSLGLGTGCRQWPVDQLPDPDQLRWNDISSLPLALITGTNGKSTSVRLAASIAKAAGLNAGLTSTDYIKVGETIIDEGDYSGPGGARMLLRDERVDIAFLELARGGLLRRGLGVPEADVVLITNVAADHLGDYGINTVPELIEAKFIVRKALKASSSLILNADDKGIVNYASGLEQSIIWFAETIENNVIHNHVESGGEAVTVIDKQIVHIKEGNKTTIVNLADVPITLNGMARHNVQNSLGVVALACALHIDYKFIKQGLTNFTGAVEENPGRGNYFEARGIKILIDFAHNEHAMTALASTVSNIQSKRLLILMGQAGDRSNEAIVDLVNAAMTANPDQMIVSETPGYERGREANEITKIIADAIAATDFPEKNIWYSVSPVEGVQKALDWAKPGDFLLFITLTKRNDVIEIVKDFVRE
jgi:UDP-N-acetylmuramyl tripeptide synthase